MRSVFRSVAFGLIAALSLSIVATPAGAAESWGLEAAAEARSSTVEVTARFTAPSGSGAVYRLDTELHDGSGIAKQHFETLRLTAGESKEFTYEWNGVASGDYRIKLGVFDESWQELHAWNNQAAEVTVARKAGASERPRSSESFWGVNGHALNQSKEWRDSRPGDSRRMERLAYSPTAQWFGGWSRNVRAEVASAVTAAESRNATAVLVAYNIVGRDCAGYSAGGAGSEGDYKSWIQDFAAGVHGEALVVLEPDALAQMCGDTDARYRMLNTAVDVLSSSGARVYIDAGHSNWIAPGVMADRLAKAGVHRAAGFAVNVANFYATTESEAYAEKISNRLGSAHYVVDTSRNGNGSSGEWCNPSEAAVGQAPTSNTTGKHADAYIWVKNVGDSDGYCNGGPAAGQWSPSHALSLIRFWY